MRTFRHGMAPLGLLAFFLIAALPAQREKPTRAARRGPQCRPCSPLSAAPAKILRFIDDAIACLDT